MSSARVGRSGRRLGGSASCTRIPETEAMPRRELRSRPSPPRPARARRGTSRVPLPRAAPPDAAAAHHPTMMCHMICAIPQGQSREILALDSSCCGSSTSLPPRCPHQKHSWPVTHGSSSS